MRPASRFRIAARIAYTEFFYVSVLLLMNFFIKQLQENGKDGFDKHSLGTDFISSHDPIDVLFMGIALMVCAVALVLLILTAFIGIMNLMDVAPPQVVRRAAHKLPRWVRQIALTGLGVTLGVGVAASIDAPIASSGPEAKPQFSDVPAAPFGAKVEARAIERSGVPELAVHQVNPNKPTEAEYWEVKPGDHLWLIAQETLAAAWGHTPTDAVMIPYWHDVIELNRSRLADPTNPDMIYPGDMIELPPLPPAPEA